MNIRCEDNWRREFGEVMEREIVRDLQEDNYRQTNMFNYTCSIIMYKQTTVNTDRKVLQNDVKCKKKLFEKIYLF